MPGSKRPEEILYDYLLQLESHHPYWEKTEGTGFTWLYFKENGPDKYDGKERDKYKKWFQDHERFFESTNLFDYWAKDNKELVEEFEYRFKTAFNLISERNFLTKLP